jgi:MFS family permease
VLVLFWIGCAVTLGIALVYSLAALAPDLAGQPGDAGRVRLAASIVALCAGSLFVGQLLATIGLTAGWHWSRILATLVCVVWCLTCIGLPLGLFALNAIWRGRSRAAPAPAPPTGP